MTYTSRYDTWLPSVSSQIKISAGSPNGLPWSLYECSVLWKAVCGSATKRPLGTTGELGYDRLNGTRKTGPLYAKSVVYI